MPALTLVATIEGRPTRLGTASAGDFPDSPEDGWATALAYREHVLRVVQRLREDPEAVVEVAEVVEWGRRLRPWTPGDGSVRPVILAAIRSALAVTTSRGGYGMYVNCANGNRRAAVMATRRGLPVRLVCAILAALLHCDAVRAP